MQRRLLMAMSEKNNSIMNTVAAGTVGLASAMASKARAQGSGKIKIGLLGCGGRGNGALRQCLNADPGVEVIAMADLFENNHVALYDLTNDPDEMNNLANPDNPNYDEGLLSGMNTKLNSLIQAEIGEDKLPFERIKSD